MGTTVEKKDPVEVLVVIVIAVLVLGVAIGPLLAMRNPAEADKLTPGADPAGESSKEPDASESSIESPTPRHTEDQPQLTPEGTGISPWPARCPIWDR